ncbi:GNAT family N-acetyltransferase [Haloarchaeobius sp. HME9146]|uniref:GNAT family N-acetyltransferase n=1 Tax=Haloarchaeobius sp. HME9146 TaxID=2978732 RepID=UPI0021BE99D8|nr:GNAT family N-acetyltransferase [Haloarchaeobius sp. HME9146]MCT9096391.1 GNAT family N-acetyltransferase [Haloarchaeobius sp. HME9146]
MRARMEPDTTTACAWNHGECEGTPFCPPRCPRFVDKHGHSLLVVPLTDEFVDPLVEMYRDYASEHRSMGLPPIGDSEIRRWIDRLHAKGQNVVALDGDRVIGHAGFVAGDDGPPEFLVYVHQDAHGRGIGTELTKHAIAFAADSGYEGLSLHVRDDNEAAVTVYRRLGFETAKREGNELAMVLDFEKGIAEEVRLAPAERAVVGV